MNINNEHSISTLRHAHNYSSCMTAHDKKSMQKKKYVDTSGGQCKFQIREDTFFFHEQGLISITAYWMTVIHIPFTQLNVTAIGLGYYMILTIPLYPL